MATASPEIAASIRPAGYGAALGGRKTQASGWNFIAAAAATGIGLETRSILATVSGATWAVSQMEAWVDDVLNSGAGLKGIPGQAYKDIDWKTVAGIVFVGISTYRTVKKGNLKDWRWV